MELGGVSNGDIQSWNIPSSIVTIELLRKKILEKQ